MNVIFIYECECLKYSVNRTWSNKIASIFQSFYSFFPQASGYGGTVKVIEVGEKIENMEKQNHRLLTVKFNADKSATMQWDFKPQQSQIKVSVLYP